MENLTASGPEPVKERPMLFSGPMAKAIWARLKTQTRRALSDKLIINQEPDRYKFHYYGECDGIQGQGACFEDLRPEITPWIQPIPCPYGEPGERLWMRENIRAEEVHGLDGVRYVADDVFVAIDNTQDAADAWVNLYHYGKRRGATVPNIHMPRWASRVLLELTAVRVERVQDISEKDAWAEGCQRGEPTDNGGFFPAEQPDPSGIGERGWDCAKDWFADLWEEINGAASWEANPWVWVLEFKEVARAASRGPEPDAPLADPFDGLAITPELEALLAQHPAQRAPIAEAYTLGLSNLREVLAGLGQPRQPGQALGGVAGRCINDLPGPLVRLLNVGVAAQLLKQWLPFGLQPQYFSKDELRGLTFLGPHVQTFIYNLVAVLAKRRLFVPKEHASHPRAALGYLEEMGDVLSLSLDELNAAADPREPLAAAKMYNELNMVQAAPLEAWEVAEAGKELVDA